MPFDHADLSDAELVRTIKRRGAVDERAVTALFQRHQRMVWSVCRRFMPTDLDAEDLLQEVFLRAYQGLPSYKGESKFSTWLYRIAVNTCLNDLRRRKLRVDAHTVPIDEHSRQLDLLHRREERQRTESNEQVQAAMESLGEDARQALELRELEGRSYTEIAAHLGITISAAKMRVRARPVGNPCLPERPAGARMSRHLSVTELSAFITGQAAENEQARILRHLESCDACLQTVDGLWRRR